jgi:hemerythrin
MVDTIVTWQNSYSVGIQLIDDQHKELINLTNKLWASCMKGRDASKAIFMQAIRSAVEYVDYHFSTEEKIMERINYPEYGAHKREHTAFVKEVLSQVEDFTNGKEFAPQSFVHYLKDWVLTHIAVCDKKLGHYLVSMKRIGTLNSVTLRVKQDKAKTRYVIG